MSTRLQMNVQKKCDLFAKLTRRLRKRKAASVRDVHDLRVCTRQLRATLTLVESELEESDYSKMKTRLQCLGKSLGRRRELDVSFKLAARYGLNGRSLAEPHVIQTKKLHRMLLSRRIRNVEKKLRKIKRAAGKIELKIRRKEMIPVLISRLVQMSQSSRVHRKMSKADIHTFRIELKKINYVLLVLGHSSERLDRLQKLLGNVHDLEVFQSHLKQDRRVKRDEKKFIHDFLSICPRGRDWKKVLDV